MWRRLKRWKVPAESTFFGSAGALAMVVWLGGELVGSHPDSGLLGFSAGMWAVWSAIRKDTQRREQRRNRDDGEERPRHRTHTDRED